MTDNKKLKIGLEVSSLINHGQDIGAGRYVLNLVRSLLDIDKINSYLLFGTHTNTKYLDLAFSLGRGLSDDRIAFRFIKIPGILTWLSAWGGGFRMNVSASGLEKSRRGA